MKTAILILLAGASAAPLAGQSKRLLREAERRVLILEDRTRTLEGRLLDSERRVAALEARLASNLTLEEQRPIYPLQEVRTGDMDTRYRLQLLSLLEKFRDEDAQIARTLIEKKAKLKIDISQQQLTAPAGLIPSQATSELVRLVRERMRQRDIVIRALLADRLGAAGQDVLLAAAHSR